MILISFYKFKVKLIWLCSIGYEYEHCDNLIFFLDYFGQLIEINKVSNEQPQSACNIERKLGEYKGRQVWKNLKSKTFKSCLI